VPEGTLSSLTYGGGSGGPSHGGAWAPPLHLLLTSSLSQLVEQVCSGNGTSQLWFSPARDIRCASVAMLCSRLLGLDLSYESGSEKQQNLQQARSASSTEGPLSPVPGWVGMTRVVLLRVCPSLHPLQTLLCDALCTPDAATCELVYVARDRLLLVSVGALRRIWLAIACVGHTQQRTGSDLPQLRAGVLKWLTSGLPAVEAFEVTLHLVWTHHTMDDSTVLRSSIPPLCSSRLHSPHSILTDETASESWPDCCVQALRRHRAGSWDQEEAAMTTFVTCFGRLWRVP
jgi:hypothetical protein